MKTFKITNLVLCFLIFFLGCKSYKTNGIEKATFKDINIFNSKLWINDSMGCKGYRQTVIDSIAKIGGNWSDKYADSNFIIQYFGKPEFRYIQNHKILFCYFNDYIHKNACQPIKDQKEAEYYYDMIGASLDFYFDFKGKLVYYTYSTR